MKILNLHFKNINSLQGENRVEFDQAPLADAGVFAITGPNGSGKTSILDAITLGLYGETFKFDRPSGHVMTKHTAASFAAVEFTSHGKQYRSTWSVNRKQDREDGELQAPQMQLLELNGSEAIIADQPNKVKDKINQLTGMDLRAFTRSIMLPQGDFSAFLNALDNERMDILEKLISADIYADYKQSVLQNAEQEKQKLNELQTKVAAVPRVNADKIAADDADLDDFKQQYTDFNQQKNELNRQLNWLKNLQTIERRIVTYQNTQIRDKQTRDAAIAELQTIAEHESVLVFQDDLQTIDAKDAAIKQHKRNLNALNNEILHLKERLKSLGIEDAEQLSKSKQSIEELKQSIADINQKLGQAKLAQQSETAAIATLQAQVNDKETSLASVTDWLKEHEAEQFLLDDFPDIGKLKSLRIELQTLQTKQKSYAKWSNTTTSTIQKSKVEIEALDKKLSRSKQKLQEYQDSLADISQGQTMEDMDELQNSQQERVVLFKDLVNLAIGNKKLDSGGLFKAMSAKEEEDSASLRTTLNEKANELAREKNIFKSLEKAVSNEALLKKYQVERVLLVDGEPCPLCGALHHPYANKAPRLTNTAKALTDQQAKLKTLQIENDKLQKQLQVVLQKEEKAQQKDTELVQIRSQWMSTCNRLNAASEEMTIGNISLMKKLLKAEKEELKQIVDIQIEYRRQENRIEKLILQIKRYEDELLLLTEKKDTLEQEWNDRPQELKDIEVKMVQYEEEAKQLTEHLTAQLQVLGMKLPKKGKEDALFDKLNTRRQEYQTYHIRKNSLLTDVQELKQKISDNQANTEQLSKTIEQYLHNLDDMEIVGIHLTLLEKQQLVEQKKAEIEPLEAEKETRLQKLQAQLPASPVNNLAELRQMLALVHRKAEFEQSVAKMELDIKTLQQDEVKANALLESERSLKVTELSEEEIAEQQRALREKMDISRHEINRLEKARREYKSLQQELDDAVKLLEQQQLTYQQCEQEIKEMSAEQGRLFRRKVQIKVADKLLTNANAYLEKISGRYYLYQRDTQQGLALEIEDSYTNNVRRLPKTLSGGESFVVSLALALALSELANNGQSLDSLFLDEGFGNLDEESLYLVVTTLKNLKNHGKTVGVISHIKGVKDRISTQIEMSKNPNGTSGFAVVS